MSSEIEVLHVIAGLALSHGGPSRSVEGLVNHLTDNKVVHVFGDTKAAQ